MKLKILVTCLIEREVESLDPDTIQSIREEVNDLPVGKFWNTENIELVIEDA